MTAAQAAGFRLTGRLRRAGGVPERRQPSRRPDAPVVPPGEDFTAVAAGGAVTLAAVSRSRNTLTSASAQFVERGLEVGGEDRPTKR